MSDVSTGLNFEPGTPLEFVDYDHVPLISTNAASCAKALRCESGDDLVRALARLVRIGRLEQQNESTYRLVYTADGADVRELNRAFLGYAEWARRKKRGARFGWNEPVANKWATVAEPVDPGDAWFDWME